MPATQVVIRDSFGNPLAVAVEIGPNQVIIETASNKAKFTELLRQLGIGVSRIDIAADLTAGELILE